MTKTFTLTHVENKPLWSDIINYEGKHYKVLCDTPIHAGTNDFIKWDITLEVEEIIEN